MTDASGGAWHPDPTGRHQHRWWDGTQWTDQVADGGVSSTDPVTTTAPTNPVPTYTAPAPSTGPNWKVIGLVAGAVVVVVILFVVLLGGSDEGPSRDQVVDDCAREGTSRSDCECVVDEYLDAGGDLDDLTVFDSERDEFDDLSDFPPDLVDSFINCVT